MEEQVRKDILNVLNKGLKAIKEEDIASLRNLSNHTIHDASIYQDDYSITIGIILYSISKIYERTNYREFKGWNFCNKCILTFFPRAIKALENNNVEKYEKIVHDLFDTIYKLDPKLRSHIIDVFQEAKIHRASRLHEHGISVGRVANILGLSEFEIMEYLGKTRISDVSFGITKDVKDRINFTRGLFK